MAIRACPGFPSGKLVVGMRVPRTESSMNTTSASRCPTLAAYVSMKLVLYSVPATLKKTN